MEDHLSGIGNVVCIVLAIAIFYFISTLAFFNAFLVLVIAFVVLFLVNFFIHLDLHSALTDTFVAFLTAGIVYLFAALAVHLGTQVPAASP
jgi:hypothetical protein